MTPSCVRESPSLAPGLRLVHGCIILDLKMPRLGGFEALPEIRQAAPAARVIVLTGSPNRPLREACRARGADEFMLEPFDPGELLRLTAQAFRRD